MKKHLLKSMLVMAMMALGANAWAGDKTVVKYSFDDAMSPALTAGSRVSFDYDKTSVITSTKFLNAWNNTNGDPGSSTVSLGSTDLSGETWTLSFEWAACGGCNSKADHTTLKAGDTNLFDLTGNSNWNTTVTITYAGSDGSKTLPVPGCDKGKRFTAAVGNQLNTTAYWHHIVVTGSASGVKMTITNSSTGTAVVEDVVLSETNVNPTSLIIEPCCGGGIGIDELLLTYYVEGEVIQTPIAAYTKVDGIKRVITATCDTEGATIQYSLDGESWTDGAEVTVAESGKVYFKAVKGIYESDVLTFDAVAGEEIVLNTPLINRTSDTSVTITADQSKLLLSPNATIYYTYGEENGSFVGSKTLTVAADAVITAYAEFEGYATSETAERAVALFPKYVNKTENTAAKTSGWSENAFSTETVTVSERTYAALLLDDAQWGQNIYLQTDGAWGLRANGNWYINSDTKESWLLMQNMKKGDIIVVDVTYPASSMVNATYSKYAFGTKQAYEVTEDGNVELALKKIDASTMDYFYGVYAYTAMSKEEIALVDAQDALKAAIAKAKAIEYKVTTTDPETGDPTTEYKNGGKDLEDAITAAENALAAENATAESLNAAKAALEDAVKAFKEANRSDLMKEAIALAADEEAVAVGLLQEAIAAAEESGDESNLQAAVDQFKTNNADQEKDQTTKVATDGWKNFDGGAAGVCATQFAPAITTYDGRNAQLAEVYESNVDRIGTIIYQDITGLENGTYKVGFYGNAFFTSGRGFESSMADGAEDVAYVFANDQKAFITAKIATSTTENNYRQFDVEVTNGTIKLGMGKEKAGTNWHTMQIYQLTWFTTAKAVYAQDKAEMKALIEKVRTALLDENKTKGQEELNAAQTAALDALDNNKLNIAEFEAEIAKLQAAYDAFIIANRYVFEGVAYIIDAESGKYMAAGHNYGTRGIVNETGLDLTFAKADNNTVTIDTKVSNGGNNHFLGSNLYMDAAAFGWALEYQGFGFYISNGTQYISIDENDNLVLSDTPREWIIVTADGVKEQRLEEMADATETAPIDVTWMLQNPNFNRNDQRVAAWVVSDDCTNKNLNGGNEVNNCAESYHSVFTISQTIEDAPAGTYQLTAQGFYRQDDNAEEEAPVFYLSTNEENIATAKVPAKTGDEGGMSAASESFTAGKYASETMGIYVNEGETITVGVKGTATHQWVIFDNFRLTYFGANQVDDLITTGISEVNTTAEAANAIYNMAGQKVQKAQKGLFIINGKKVVK